MNKIFWFRSVLKVPGIGLCSFAILFVLLFLTIGASPQKTMVDCIPASLPTNLRLREAKPVKYNVVTEYYNEDIFGNFFNKTRVSGQYTRGLAGGNARWNGVMIANAGKKDEMFDSGTRQDSMESLQYDPATVMANDSISLRLPADNVYCKTLTLDMFTFESFAWSHFDSLHLNVPYHARVYDTDFSLGASGNFINNDVKLIWTGISMINNRRCVLIQFEALENRLHIKMGAMDAKGRSHYWGNIWVCLEDKQIEEVWMNEDIMLEIDLPAKGKQMMNTIRKVTVKKVKG